MVENQRHFLLLAAVAKIASRLHLSECELWRIFTWALHVLLCGTRLAELSAMPIKLWIEGRVHMPFGSSATGDGEGCGERGKVGFVELE